MTVNMQYTNHATPAYPTQQTSASTGYPMQKALDDVDPTSEHTLPIVRAKVKSMLMQSAAFRALPPEKQREVAHNTVKVARFMADAGGQTAGVPMGAIIDNPVAARESSAPLQGAPARTAADGDRPANPVRGEQVDFTGVQDTYTAPAASGAGDILSGQIEAVDFPGFVGGLIEGVFNAIVESSIQQMEAYGSMVANVAKTVDQYMQDNVSPAQAKDQLVSSQPDLFQAVLSGEGRVAPRDDADDTQMGGFLESLGLPFDLDTSDEETMEAEVVPAIRKSMAMDRQKLLATMVLMGINRIVVTDGRIQASVKFDISARDIARRAREIETSFEFNYNRRTDKKKKSGWWIFGKSKESERTRLNVTTSIDTGQTDESESTTQLKTKLTGNVDLRFKSETFPLEKMLDVLGTSESIITQQANQATPQQAQQVQPALQPPPPPPLAPAPTPPSV